MNDKIALCDFLELYCNSGLFVMRKTICHKVTGDGGFERPQKLLDDIRVLITADGRCASTH